MLWSPEMRGTCTSLMHDNHYIFQRQHVLLIVTRRAVTNCCRADPQGCVSSYTLHMNPGSTPGISAVTNMATSRSLTRPPSMILYNSTILQIMVNVIQRSLFVDSCFKGTNLRSWIESHEKHLFRNRCANYLLKQYYQTNVVHIWQIISSNWPIDSPPKMASWRTIFVGPSIVFTCQSYLYKSLSLSTSPSPIIGQK